MKQQTLMEDYPREVRIFHSGALPNVNFGIFSLLVAMLPSKNLFVTSPFEACVESLTLTRAGTGSLLLLWINLHPHSVL